MKEEGEVYFRENFQIYSPKVDCWLRLGRGEKRRGESACYEGSLYCYKTKH